jgi:hypothetical protein
MNTDENFVELFRQFVEEKFRSHLSELNHGYGTRQYGSAEPNEYKYRDLRKRFNQEIQRKIDSLIASGKPWLHNDLQKIKKEYLTKFDLMEQA